MFYVTHRQQKYTKPNTHLRKKKVKPVKTFNGNAKWIRDLGIYTGQSLSSARMHTNKVLFILYIHVSGYTFSSVIYSHCNSYANILLKKFLRFDAKCLEQKLYSSAISICIFLYIYVRSKISSTMRELYFIKVQTYT